MSHPSCAFHEEVARFLASRRVPVEWISQRTGPHCGNTVATLRNHYWSQPLLSLPHQTALASLLVFVPAAKMLLSQLALLGFSAALPSPGRCAAQAFSSMMTVWRLAAPNPTPMTGVVEWLVVLNERLPCHSSYLCRKALMFCHECRGLLLHELAG